MNQTNQNRSCSRHFRTSSTPLPSYDPTTSRSREQSLRDLI
jgi:hypothetical protein